MCRKSFVPVALIVDTLYPLVVHPTVPIRSTEGFHRARQGPARKLNVGSAGNGSGSHLTGALFSSNPA